MSSDDRGLPILRQTPCAVGNHVWVSTGTNFRGEPTIRPGQPCACGRHLWPPPPVEEPPR